MESNNKDLLLSNLTSLSFTNETIEELNKIALLKGVTINQLLSSMISNEIFLKKKIDSGHAIILEKPNGKFLKVYLN